jgi:hypothetical protein
MVDERTNTYLFYIRWTAGLILLVLGIAFLFIPFIPLGYIMLLASIVVVGPQLPYYDKAIDWLAKKDKSNKVRILERKLRMLENKMENRIISWFEGKK